MKRDTHYFERWARSMGMKPYLRVQEDRHGDILLADSGTLISDPPSEHGYSKFYRTGYCIYREGAWIAACEEYPPDAFPSATLAGKQEARINECLEYARMYLQQFVEAGLFDPNQKGRFSRVH